jgi:hypothetical protein
MKPFAGHENLALGPKQQGTKNPSLGGTLRIPKSQYEVHQSGQNTRRAKISAF